MADTTSINDLPISPQTDNIQLETNDKNQIIENNTKKLSEQREKDDKKIAGMQHNQNVISGALPPTGAPHTGIPHTGNPPTGNPPSTQHVAAIPPSTKNMNEFVSGIQSAAASGALGLPSRDIPQQQTHITQDVATKPNYVPEGPDDYILKHQSQEDIINQHTSREKQGETVDNIYDELQTPVLIGILYFLFQMPIVKKQMMKILPTIFLKDGNLKLSGYITYSILFSGMYYASSRTVNYLSI